jgi:hypothetical protein
MTRFERETGPRASDAVVHRARTYLPEDGHPSFESYSGNQTGLELDVPLLLASHGGINGRVAAAPPAGELVAIAIRPPPHWP